MVGGFYMGKKGQKYNTYTPEFKQQVLQEYLNGEGGEKTLAKRHGIPDRTISNWIKKGRNNIDVTIDNRGRGSIGKGPQKKELTLEDYKERYEILKKYQAFLKARQEKK